MGGITDTIPFKSFGKKKKKMPGQTFSPFQKHLFLKPTHKLSLKMQLHKGALGKMQCQRKKKNECPTKLAFVVTQVVTNLKL